MNISLINDIKNTCSPNAVNDKGRKLCPITLDILTCDNTINLDGVLYSSYGFVKWVRTELAKEYRNLEELCKESSLFTEKSVFLQFVNIRSPITNVVYDIDNISRIFEVFVWKCFSNPIECVYDFINIDNYI